MYNSSEEEEKYKYSHDIPEEYNISFSEYMNGFNELMSTSREIHNLLDKNGQEKWVCMTIIVHNQSTLKVEFDYADWLNSSYTSNQRLKYFQYTHLGKIPQNELEMKLSEEMEEFQKKITVKILFLEEGGMVAYRFDKIKGFYCSIGIKFPTIFPTILGPSSAGANLSG